MKSTSLLSIKKPCQNLNTSCSNNDTLTTFAKFPPDVRALPKRKLSPIGKLVFCEYAERSRGTNRPVLVCDRDVANGCGGISRTSVIAAIKQLLKQGLFEKHGKPVNQVQAYRIIHPMFKEMSGKMVKAEAAAKKGPKSFDDWVECKTCNKKRPSLLKVGWCRSCQWKLNVEKIADARIAAAKTA